LPALPVAGISLQRAARMLDGLEGFRAAEIDTGETTIFLRWGGAGPPLLLLHGFPETHLMWRGVAPLLARDFTVVCADLRGYGQSGCPPSADDHGPYSKRAAARDMMAVMERLGFVRFMVAGHDRGGRVACRMALDYPTRIERLAVLDILPTETVWARADARFALAYWPWALLAQPKPLPERILLTAAGAIVDSALDGWGSPATAFPADIREAYTRMLLHPRHGHAICEEYRAAAGIDRDHEQADRRADRKIACPLLVLWGAGGPLDTWYTADGGPLALWREWCGQVEGGSIKAGHFFPEEEPEETAQALRAFFAGG
jgi:haloacetate dehalogenase